MFVSQEVGVDYSADLSEALAAEGYAGEFCPKELATREGEATFWRETVFTLKVLEMELEIQEQEQEQEQEFRKWRNIASTVYWRQLWRGEGWRRPWPSSVSGTR